MTAKLNTPINVLARVSDPANRTWRVVEVNGAPLGHRMNDTEIHVPLASGAVLSVRDDGEARLDPRGVNPGPGATLSEQVEITVEADDGPVRLTYETNGKPWVRGRGTRLETTFPVRISGYAPAWTPASAAPAYWGDPSHAASLVAAGGVSAGAARYASERGMFWFRDLLDRAGGARYLRSPSYNEASDRHPREYPCAWRRHGDDDKARVLFFEYYLANSIGTNQRLAFDAAVSAQTVLMVARAGSGATALIEDALAAVIARSSSTGYTLPSTGDAFVNGEQVLAAGTNTGDMNDFGQDMILAFRLASPHDWTRLWKVGTGVIREVVLVAGAMSDADIQRWMGYAAHKHDLAFRLPPDHPYRWGPPGFETPAVEPSPTPAAADMGRWTQAGHGGVTAAYLGGAKTITGGDPNGHFTVTKGRIVPTAAFVAARPAGGTVYNLTLSNGDAIALTVVEGVMHAATGREAGSAVNLSAASKPDPCTIIVRNGRVGRISGNSAAAPAGGLTLKAETRRRVEVAGAIGVQNAGAGRSVVVEGFHISRMSGPFDKTGSNTITVGGSDYATVRDCAVIGDWLDPTWNYFERYHNYQSDVSINVFAKKVAIGEDNEIRFCNPSARCVSDEKAIWRRNWTYSRFGDGTLMRPDGTGVTLAEGSKLWEREFLENVDIDSLGINNYVGDPHCDWSQIFFQSYEGIVAVNYQRNFLWQSTANKDHTGTNRQGARGVYLENSPTRGDDVYLGIFSGNVAPSPMDAPTPFSVACWGVLCEDNSFPWYQSWPVDANVGFANAPYQGRRNILNRSLDASAKSLWPDEDNVGQSVVTVDQLAAVVADPTYGASDPATWTGKVTPVAGGPADLGGGGSAGAVTLSGALKPLKTGRAPLRPSAPAVALNADNESLDVTLAADPQDFWGEGLPITRRDLAWSDKANIAREKGVAASDTSMASWTYIQDVAGSPGGVVNVSGLPGATTVYIRQRCWNANGKGLWSKASAGVAMPIGRPARMKTPSTEVSGASIKVLFDPPLSDGGSAITGYEMRYAATEAGLSATTPQAWTDGQSLTSLAASSYFIQTRAVNAIGAGDWSPARETAVHATYWTPASEPSLFAWWDAADEASVVINGTNDVSQLTDKSGNLRHMLYVQGFARSRRAGTDYAINGKNTVRFTTSSKMDTAALTPPSLASMAMVRQIDTPTTPYGNIFRFRGDAGPRLSIQGSGIGANSSTYPGILHGNNSQSGPALADDADGIGIMPTAAQVTKIITLRGDQTEFEAWVDGKIFDEAEGVQERGYLCDRPLDTPLGASNVKISISHTEGSGDSSPAGRFAECAIFGADDDALRRRYEGYLAHKWGLVEQLPGDHPYKSAPPARS